MRLRDLATGAVAAVGDWILIGRSSTCAMRLDGKRVSAVHASVSWDGRRYVLRDMGSRNGTYRNGVKLSAAVEVPLADGDVLAFGGKEEPGWTAEDVGRLPEPRGPDAWRTFSMTDDGEGLPLTTLAHVTLRFVVSRDQDHVAVEAHAAGGAVSLGCHEHWWPVFLLARQRVADRADPPSEQGWLDREVLARMAGKPVAALNLSFLRARRELQERGVVDAQDVVEVRTGQRRFGLPPERTEIASGRDEPSRDDLG